MISARLALGMAGVLALCAPASAEELVLPSEVASSHWKTGYMEQFAQKVNEATDGDIKVKIFPSGQLYSDQAAVAALGTGAVQMVWPVSVRLETISPETGVINLPFALSDDMMEGKPILGALFGAVSKVAIMPAWRGALPSLVAAAGYDPQPGGYIGPDGFREMRGDPAPATIAPQALDPDAGRRLWEACEKLTKVSMLS